MKLIFKLDKKYDEMMLWEFMPTKGKGYKQKLADLLRIDQEDLEIALKNNNNDLKKSVKFLVERKYQSLKPFLRNAAKNYQESWSKINDKFAKMVAKKTGQKWKHDKYFCIVSAYHEGISSWGGNIIARRWSINSDTQKKVTAHELALSHCWSMLEKNKIAKKWNDDKKWKYSEILAWCLLDLDTDFHRFWPWLLKKHLFPEDHQYPEILPLQKKLKKLYLKSKNFRDFLEEAVKTT